MTRSDSYPGSLDRRESGSFRWQVGIGGERHSEHWASEDLRADRRVGESLHDVAGRWARDSYNRVVEANDLAAVVASDSASDAVVYVVQASITGLVKIGTSQSPRRRLRSIQGACAQPLVVVGCVRGADVDTEEYLHNALREHRARGEWFRHSGPVRRLVGALFHELGPGRQGVGLVNPPEYDAEPLQGVRAATEVGDADLHEMVGSR